MYRNSVLLILVFSLVACQNSFEESEGTIPPDHKIWSDLLGSHVDDAGMVDYEGFLSDSTKLDSYLVSLSANPPSSGWSEQEKLAYWINAYNAFTVKLILNNYPLSSIRDIGSSIQIPFVNSPWDIRFIEIGKRRYDLNDIEHGILREKFNEPRIHFAINCASISCPLLRNEAYTAKELERQLEEQAVAFLNDPQRNQISKSEVKISKIFNWFRGDFIKDGKLLDYINKYSRTQINSDARIKYLEYDWRLNEQNN